jgi:adenylosuccinate synthase
MAAKNKAAQAGAGAFAAGKAVRSNPYVKRVMEDPELRENLRSAFDSARKAYTRMSNSKGPMKAMTEDKKVQRELKAAASSLKNAADSLRGNKKKKRRKGRLLLVAVVGAGLALALSEGLRKKVLDTLFGAEEEFEYTASTTPEPPAGASSSESESEPVGTS